MTQANFTAPAPVAPDQRPKFTSTIRLHLRVPAKLRNLELALVIFAAIIVTGAIALVQLGAEGRLFPNMLSLAAVLGLAGIAMHIVLRFVASEADPFVLPVSMLLNGLGIAEILPHRPVP